LQLGQQGAVAHQGQVVVFGQVREHLQQQARAFFGRQASDKTQRDAPLCCGELGIHGVGCRVVDDGLQGQCGGRDDLLQTGL